MCIFASVRHAPAATHHTHTQQFARSCPVALWPRAVHQLRHITHTHNNFLARALWPRAVHQMRHITHKICSLVPCQVCNRLHLTKAIVVCAPTPGREGLQVLLDVHTRFTTRPHTTNNPPRRYTMRLWWLP